MSTVLRLEDLFWEGSNLRRHKSSSGTHFKAIKPIISSDDFRFTVKVIHGASGGSGVMIGVCDINHLTGSYFGQGGKLGWSWQQGKGVYGTGINNKMLNEKFSAGDSVTVIVHRNEEKSIEFQKNEKFMGKLEDLWFPKDLVIAIYAWGAVELELTEFSPFGHHHHPLLLEQEKEKEETTSIELKMKEFLEDTLKLKISEIQKKIDGEVISLREEIEDLKLKNLSLSRKYDEHVEMYHRSRYDIIKSSTTPPMLKKGDGDVFFCFMNDTFVHQFYFSVLKSGTRARNEELASIDFSNLKVQMNERMLESSRIKIVRNMIEFEAKYTKMGRNEVAVPFQNVKKVFTVEVEPSELSDERTQLDLFLADVEPSGDILRKEDVQPTDKFSSNDIFQVVLTFSNENGVPLRYKHVEDFEFTVKLVPAEASGGKKKKKGLKGILSCTNMVEIQEDRDISPEGEFIVCTVGEKKKKLEAGKYTISVADEDFLKKKLFEIVD